MPLLASMLVASLLAQEAPQAQHDAISVVLPKERAALLEQGARSGRVILLLTSGKLAEEGVAPINAPFYDSPQPIYSVPVSQLVPGQPIVLGEDAAAFPVPLDQLTGSFQVQAVFARDGALAGHLVPGNLYSAPQAVQLDATRADAAALELTLAMQPEPEPTAPNLSMFSMKSTLLSSALGRDVTMKAGVALPPGWGNPNHRRRMWPAIFVIPPRGGHDTDAMGYAKLLSTEGSQAVVPQAVWIVLDPNGPWGHHGFVDSAANGPRMRALVEELIPELSRQYRLIARPEARLLMGHGLGGWSALWLQLNRPDFFGACFSSAPAPVDFSAFQTTDLRGDLSLFTDAEGRERPCYRVPIVQRFEKVRMTAREEAGMEYALSPEGRSGEALDCCAAMWSALDPRTNRPRRLCNPATGAIERSVVESDWSRFDIAQMLRGNPRTFAPILRQRVRLLAAERDNFYFQRAVQRLREQFEASAAELATQGTPLPEGPGYITILPDQTHFTLSGTSIMVWQAQMCAYLHSHGLD